MNKIYYLIKSPPPPNSRVGFQGVLNNGTHQARDAPAPVARRSRERQQDGTYIGTRERQQDGTYIGTHPFLIWSRKLVKSTREKAVIWLPEGVKNHVRPAQRRTKGRPLVHWSTSDKTKARKRENKGQQVVLSSVDAPPREYPGKVSYFWPFFRSSDELRKNGGRIKYQWTEHSATRSDGTARHVHSTLAPF